ncbi:hypothetical protein N7468_007844 [Penicillium chermesinum]|uniref:Uncharacterized protein n=1 Tax=Penicillium chermesinum TaxID=63820 RepID=A0A9W9NNQ0_9EURO|nr:uncharacterized protein N7468_007844 [Penicillium chermesinum]KAJ5223302.1 hypothetical protein N7468_007844 [Penicillium chermesinum]
MTHGAPYGVGCFCRTHARVQFPGSSRKPSISHLFPPEYSEDQQPVSDASLEFLLSSDLSELTQQLEIQSQSPREEDVAAEIAKQREWYLNLPTPTPHEISLPTNSR